ncbi:MAG TPA: carbohydrate ABC transporter permease [Candidatus Dormibacteraeota bacterium]|nr:carbohydrate ABC transporter permease [Candidatus Dormibacteraeota bacterium]
MTTAAKPARQTAFERSTAFLEGRGVFWGAQRLLVYAALIFFAVVFLFPFLWLVSNSLKDPLHIFDANLIPQPVMWQNYRTIFEETQTMGTPLAAMIRNSVIVSVLGVGAVLISSSMIAFGLAKLKFPGANIVFFLVLMTMMLPGEVTIVPVYLIWRKVADVTGGLIGTGTLFPLWLGGLFGSSFYIFMLRQFFLGIPNELIEAARVDGASYFRIFWQIMLPLIRPALLAVAVLEFQAKWNDFMGPLIYVSNKPDLWTLPIGLFQLNQHFGFGQFRYELIFAAAVLMLLPSVALFFLAQKQFIKGLSAGAVKG